MFQSFLILGVSIALSVSAQLMLKKGMLAVGELDFSLANLLKLIFEIFQNVYLFLGLFFFGISFLLWLFVLSKLQLNLVYPISTAVNFALITAASWFLFREQFSLLQVAGIGAIVLGIYLLIKP